TKNVTRGEGGAIVIRNEALTEPLRQARLHGMTADAINRYRNNRYRHWDMVRLGCKANLPDLLAALLPRQIETILQRLPARRTLADRYRSAFAGGPIVMPKQVEGCTSAEHAFVIHVPPAVRDDAIEVLNEAGIGVGVHFRSVPTTTYYRDKYGFKDTDFPVSRAWGEGAISLPLYSSLTVGEQDYVIDTVRERVYPLCDATRDRARS
ncbi:DegT/DnrJ/EryC1/StrS family aminotransferase, partial [Nostoc sp. NIES-2111]